MTTFDGFGKLHAKHYSVDALETGHPGYDHFLASALAWQGTYAALDSYDLSLLEREVPFVVAISSETPEALGRAMLINTYAMPWKNSSAEMARVGGLLRIFSDFTRSLPHALISAEDATDLLNEIPQTLMQDELELFEVLFFRSFPSGTPARLKEALGTFLEHFYEFEILGFANGRAIITRHEKLWTYLGRNLSDHPFYRERDRVFELARRRAVRLTSQLGPVHASFAAAALNGDDSVRATFRSAFQAEIASASRAERGQMITDACRILLLNRTPSNTSRWARAGAPDLPSILIMPQEDLIAQLRMPMDLSPNQACTILECLSRHGNRFASNYPTLGYGLAHRLARSLPVGRPDLERLVRNTDYQTDQAVKDILLDALRGTRRGLLERLLRRFIPRLFRPHGLQPLWAQWINEKRQNLLETADSRQSLGSTVQRAGTAENWRAVAAEAHDLDIVGFAKRIALAQSDGADITPWLEDLQSLSAILQENLQRSEFDIPTTETTAPLAHGERDATGYGSEGYIPSLFGLNHAPTGAQVIACWRKTLCALDRLIARIELCERNPELIPFEARMHAQTKAQDFALHLTLLAHGIDHVTAAGISEALPERLAGFDFSLLGGPYVEDTEPSFSEYEADAWRSSIQGLAGLPEAVAQPIFDRVAECVFSPLLEPNRADYAYAPEGYHQERLADAVIRTLIVMPWTTGKATLNRLQARAQTTRLQKRFSDAVERIGFKKGRLS